MMRKIGKFITKGSNILARRLREQGLRTTLLWVYGRGVPKLTGVPLLRYSRVTPQLFVGPQYGRRGYQLLAREGVDYSVNMRVEYDVAAEGLALPNYCHLPTVDDTAPSVEHLDKGVDFITRAIEAQGKVYIHCAGGIGRAPTMAAAYLMSTGMTLAEALALIKRVRPFISITPPQMEALCAYESAMRARDVLPALPQDQEA
ncbi:MAG: protein-tyrosine phosphatase family protein [Chloroflexota bacterium]